MASDASSATKENNPPLGRKRTLSKLPISTKQRSRKAKPAPDFSKLHHDWNRKFEMGKACQKKGTTLVHEFDLTQPGTKFCDATVKECDENYSCFTPDMKSLDSIVSDRGLASSLASGRATIAISRVPSQTKNRHVFSELPCSESQSKRPKPPSRFAEEQQQNGIGFEIDKAALKSIITDKGIKTPQPTFRQTTALTTCTPIQQMPRNSIYFQATTASLFDSLTQYRNFVKSRLDSQLANVPEVKQEVGVRSNLESAEVCSDKLSNEPLGSVQKSSQKECATPKSNYSVGFQESPFVKGPIMELKRNSVYVNVMYKPIVTPTSTTRSQPLCRKANSAQVCRVLAPNYNKTPHSNTAVKARRVHAPTYNKTPQSNTFVREESSSVKKIRKVLRWCDILESPSTFQKSKDEWTQLQSGLFSVPTSGPQLVHRGHATDVLLKAKSKRIFRIATAQIPEPVILPLAVQGCREASASEGNGQSCSEIRLLDESSSPVSHPSTSSAEPRHAATAHHNTPEEHTTQSGYAVSALHRTHVDAGDSVSHVLTAATDTWCHSDDICTSQIQVLDEQKRKIQKEMLQLKVAMEEESRGQVDNHQSPHLSIGHTHHLPLHPVVPISLHPTTISPSEPHTHHLPLHPVVPISLHPTVISPSEPHPAVDNHPALISSHQAMHSFAISAIPHPNFDLPPGINLSGRVNIEQPGDASNINLTIMQQLEAAKQKQEELRRLQVHLEQQLQQCAIQEQAGSHSHQSAVSAQQSTLVSLLSATAECNNNDLKDSMPCIPIACPPCRQEHSVVDSSDVNDNYRSISSVVCKKLDSPTDADHAGNDLKTEHLFMDIENSEASESVSEPSGPESVPTSWQKLKSLHGGGGSVFVSTDGEQLKQDTGESHVNFERVVDLVVPCDDDEHPATMQAEKCFLTTKSSLQFLSTTDSATDVCSRKQVYKSQLSNMNSHISGSCFKQSPGIILPTAEIAEKLESRVTSVCEIKKIAPPIWTPMALKVAASLTRSQVTCDDGVDLTRSRPTVCELNTVSDNSSSSRVDVIPQHLQTESCKLGSLSLRANLKTNISPVREKQTIFGCSLYMDALLDEEVALFSCRLKNYFIDLERERICPDPVAMTLSGGDDMHFVPIAAEDSSHNGPLIGSAFSLYYNIQDRA